MSIDLSTFKTDYSETPLDRIKQLSKSGDPVAQFELALRYGAGNEIRFDSDIFRFLLTQSAEGGYVEAQFLLSRFCYEGWFDGESRDEEGTIKWLRKAARQGHIEARRNLGNYYLMRKSDESDYEEAAIWLGLASQQGDAPSQFFLSGLYLAGKGVPKKPEEAIRLLKESAEQSFPPAEAMLGL